MSKKQHICPTCGSRNTRKRGHERGLQTYSCNDCERRWRNERRSKEPDQFWYRYVFGKQTIRELHDETGYDKKTIFKYLDEVVIPEKKHEPRQIHLVVEEKEKTDLLRPVFLGIIPDVLL